MSQDFSYLKTFIKEVIKESLIFEIAPQDFNSEKRAVITAGGPGAGKSTVARLILGGLGFQDRDVDDMLVYLLRREKMGTDMSQYSPEQHQKKDELRNKTFSWIEKSQNSDIEKGRGVIVNTTGADVGFTLGLKKKFEDAGYDVKMLYIDSSLEDSLARNKMRQRSLPQEVLQQKHKQVSGNLEAYRSAFGDNFHYYMNGPSRPSLKDPEIISISKDFTNWRAPRS